MFVEPIKIFEIYIFFPLSAVYLPSHSPGTVQRDPFCFTGPFLLVQNIIGKVPHYRHFDGSDKTGLGLSYPIGSANIGSGDNRSGDYTKKILFLNQYKDQKKMSSPE